MTSVPTTSAQARRALGVSLTIGSLATALLAWAATYTSSPLAQKLAAPFGLVGFVLGNQHQGNALISLLAMLTTFTGLSLLALLLIRRAASKRL